jgi:aerobic carbon-monoxide dehydrogenase medium subunit
MKAAAFELIRAATLADATSLLERDNSRVLAGGQSLGPMLNLRVARPDLLVQINHIAELRAMRETADAVTIGACVTHATIADGGAPDIGLRVLQRVADNIAYRAVRNRGTLGGSLCHADPAADWVTVLTALDAEALTSRGRSVPIAQFITGAFRTTLQPGELLHAVRIPRLSRDARWGYVKACRKPGEFAHAMAAILIDPPRGIRRAVIGATGGRPILLTGDAASIAGATSALDPAASGLDPIAAHMQTVVLARAMAMADA